jgi:hypothetical protein
MKRQWLLIVAGLLIGGAVPGWNIAIADELNAVDAAEINAVVQAQLDAFANDDAQRAFALASTQTRMLIGDPDDFLRLVKEQYTPVYRNRFAFFFKPETVHGATFQIVSLTAPDSRVWIALYRVEREEDGNWKIDGCQLLETSSVSI